MAKYSIWGIANRIKIESLNEPDMVKDSIFEWVYRKADRIFFEIIREMQEMQETQHRSKDYNDMWDDQIANVISFLGGRGRGKTSAMLSFYAYLGNLERKKNGAWGKWAKQEDKRIRFVEIPCIDAAALAQNEFIIEVILAKMWDAFDDIVKKNPHNSHDSHLEYLMKSVREGFVKVQKSYIILREKETNKERVEEIPAASALHELAASMNFKSDFEQLVRDYIKVLNFDQYDRYKEEEAGYLVLAIDDIDMAGSKAQSILEQIRRFLSIPRVVVLLTADIERLKNVCEEFYQKVYPKGRDLHKFVSEYLEKVLPTNQRIYMPELSENQKEIPICKDERKDKKLQLKSTNEKEMILEIMAQKCEIYFDGSRRERHFLQNDSLRGLVNYFNNIADIEDNEYTAWLKNDLQERIVERVENEGQKEFIKKLLMKDYEDVNGCVLRYIKENVKNGDKLINLADKSMGQVLYACGLLEDEGVENTDFVNCILLLYTIILHQVKDEAKNKLREKIIGNSIWGAWEYGVLTSAMVNTDFISGFANRAELRLQITDKVEGYLKEERIPEAVNAVLDINKNEIMGWLYVMLFIDAKRTESISFKMTRELRIDSSGNIRFYVLQPQITATRSYFGFLYKSVGSYQSMLQSLLREALMELYNGICKEQNVVVEKDRGDEVIRQHMTYIADMKLQNQSTCMEFVQSAEIVYSVGRKIGEEKMTNTSETDKLYEKMSSICRIIKDELDQRDKYYFTKTGISPGFMQNFSQILQVKIFLEPDSIMDIEVKKSFVEYFTKLFRGLISVNIDEER